MAQIRGQIVMKTSLKRRDGMISEGQLVGFMWETTLDSCESDTGWKCRRWQAGRTGSEGLLGVRCLIQYCQFCNDGLRSALLQSCPGEQVASYSARGYQQYWPYVSVPPQDSLLSVLWFWTDRLSGSVQVWWSEDLLPAFCRWCGPPNFKQCPALTGAVHSRVWSGWDKNQHLHVWGHGPQLEKDKLSTLGQGGGPASSGGVQVSWDLVRKWGMEREIDKQIGVCLEIPR